MPLIISDIVGVEAAVDSAGELEAFLARRHMGLLQKYKPDIPDVPYNHFWLSHSVSQFPLLGVSILGELAYLWYTPDDGHPGYSSLSGSEADGTTDFYISEYPADAICVSNDCIVSTDTAITIAHEFLNASTLPMLIRWHEL